MLSMLRIRSMSGLDEGPEGLPVIAAAGIVMTTSCDRAVCRLDDVGGSVEMRRIPETASEYPLPTALPRTSVSDRQIVLSDPLLKIEGMRESRPARHRGGDRDAGSQLIELRSR